jgi:hypothetical protein
MSSDIIAIFMDGTTTYSYVMTMISAYLCPFLLHNITVTATRILICSQDTLRIEGLMEVSSDFNRHVEKVRKKSSYII